MDFITAINGAFILFVILMFALAFLYDKQLKKWHDKLVDTEAELEWKNKIKTNHS